MDKSKIRVVIAYKNFSRELLAVSHVGLGVTANFCAKTLLSAGIKAQAKAVFGGDDLMAFIEEEHKNNDPISHVIVCAQWIPTEWFGRLCIKFPFIKFALNCHSNVGFLQAEPPAIDKLREAIDLQTAMANFTASANNHRLVSAIYEMYGRRIGYLPNLYYTTGQEKVVRPNWQGGTIRIGAFGSNRTYKNMSNAIAASIAISQQMHTPAEIWINAGRSDGDGNIVSRTAVAWTKDLPNVTLKYLDWAQWPSFKRYAGSMHLLMQPSYTETFNNVTADGICEGVPSVVTESIEWAPQAWKAQGDDTVDIANVGRRLLLDTRAGEEGYSALRNYVANGLIQWQKYLGI